MAKSPRHGQAESEADVLDAASLAPLLSTRWAGRTLASFESCSSTNDVAATRARSGAPHGLCVLAESQERGRGRQGRVWFSPPRRNVYLSLLARPKIAPAQVPPLALAMGVAAHEAARQLGVPADLKWPNDLLVRGRKLAGILLEAASDSQATTFVVIGVGLNVNLAASEIPAELGQTATSVRIETARFHPRSLVASLLLDRMEREYERFMAQGPGPAVRAFAEAAPMWGKRVRVLSDTGHPIDGIAESISEEGALHVRDDWGILHTIVAGEVVLPAR